MPSRQPISTLFPYTTLFRSEDAHQPGQLGDADDLLVRDVAEEGVAVERQRVVLAQRVEVDRSLDDLADVAVRTAVAFGRKRGEQLGVALITGRRLEQGVEVALRRLPRAGRVQVHAERLEDLRRVALELLPLLG